LQKTRDIQHTNTAAICPEAFTKKVAMPVVEFSTQSSGRHPTRSVELCPEKGGRNENKQNMALSKEVSGSNFIPI